MPKTMVHKWDEKTGEYLGSFPTHESPRQPGFFHTPKNSSDVAPPTTGKNEVAVWNDADVAWVIMEDHRGLRGFVGKKPFEITEIGPLPEGWSDEAPIVTPDEGEEGGGGGEPIDLSGYVKKDDLDDVIAAKMADEQEFKDAMFKLVTDAVTENIDNNTSLKEELTNLINEAVSSELSSQTPAYTPEEIEKIVSGLVGEPDAAYTKDEIKEMLDALEVDGAPAYTPEEIAKIIESIPGDGSASYTKEEIDAILSDSKAAPSLDNIVTKDMLETLINEKISNSDGSALKEELIALIETSVKENISGADSSDLKNELITIINQTIEGNDAFDLSSYATKEDIESAVNGLIPDLTAQNTKALTQEEIEEIKALFDARGKTFLTQEEIQVLLNDYNNEKAGQGIYIYEKIDDIYRELVADGVTDFDWPNLNRRLGLMTEAIHSDVYTKTEIRYLLEEYVKHTVLNVDGGEGFVSYDGLRQYLENTATYMFMGKDETYTKVQIDAAIGSLSAPDMSNYYTKAQTDSKITAAKPTTCPLGFTA